jgi:hypothetical protein
MMGSDYRKSLTEEDYEMVFRCCRNKGVDAAGFDLASQKTGLVVSKIIE